VNSHTSFLALIEKRFSLPSWPPETLTRTTWRTCSTSRRMVTSARAFDFDLPMSPVNPLRRSRL